MNTTQEKPLQIYPHMCEQQANDIENMLNAIDAFGATALGLSASNAQGYTTFIETRDQVRELVYSIVKNYRLVTS